MDFGMSFNFCCGVDKGVKQRYFENISFLVAGIAEKNPANVGTKRQRERVVNRDTGIAEGNPANVGTKRQRERVVTETPGLPKAIPRTLARSANVSASWPRHRWIAMNNFLVVTTSASHRMRELFRWSQRTQDSNVHVSQVLGIFASVTPRSNVNRSPIVEGERASPRRDRPVPSQPRAQRPVPRTPRTSSRRRRQAPVRREPVP